MLNHFLRDLEGLTGEILKLAVRAEEAIHASIQALHDGRRDLAQQVIDGDAAIDQAEVKIEEDCLKILALHQPVAGDLRRVAAVLKINNDLERMADLAVNIAERALSLIDLPQAIPIPETLEAMTAVTVRMVRGSLDAFLHSDAAKARAIIALDDQVDRHHRQIIDEIKALIRAQPACLDASLHLFSAAGHLERIADHATNIAEDVVYLKEGTIIRHRHPQGSESPGGP